MGENRIAQHGIEHSPDHRGLNCGHQFARLDAGRGESRISSLSLPIRIFMKPRRSETVLVRSTSAIGILAGRYSIPSRRASDSFRPTRASSGSVNMQNGTRRFFVLRLLPVRFACTTQYFILRVDKYYCGVIPVDVHGPPFDSISARDTTRPQTTMRSTSGSAAMSLNRWNARSAPNAAAEASAVSSCEVQTPSARSRAEPSGRARGHRPPAAAPLCQS